MPLSANEREAFKDRHGHPDGVITPASSVEIHGYGQVSLEVTCQIIKKSIEAGYGDYLFSVNQTQPVMIPVPQPSGPNASRTLILTASYIDSKGSGLQDRIEVLLVDSNGQARVGHPEKYYEMPNNVWQCTEERMPAGNAQAFFKVKTKKYGEPRAMQLAVCWRIL